MRLVRPPLWSAGIRFLATVAPGSKPTPPQAAAPTSGWLEGTIVDVGANRLLSRMLADENRIPTTAEVYKTGAYEVRMWSMLAVSGAVFAYYEMRACMAHHEYMNDMKESHDQLKKAREKMEEKCEKTRMAMRPVTVDILPTPAENEN